jgi:hypothetical protein
LDPRTIGLLVGEIRNAIESGRTQIIATTHSPHLMNLLLLEHIVLVERNEGGEPTFTRPGDNKELRRWSKQFAPGDLYTMSHLQKPKAASDAQKEEAGSWADAAKKLVP